MKSVFLCAIIFFTLGFSDAYSMSSGKTPDDGSRPDGMTAYQLRVVGGNWLSFQGIVAFFDKNGVPKTQRIFGNTPYILNIESKGGISAYFRVSNIQPFNRFGGIFRLILFKGNTFAEERRGYIMNSEVALKYGKYPNIDLEFMVPPVGFFN